MSTIRVAVLNRDRGDGSGGDLVGIACRMEALRKLGVDVEYVCGEDLATRLSGFDLAHLWHINFRFCEPNFDALRVAGIPYVVTPVFYPEWPDEIPHAAKLEVLASAAAILPYSRREGEELREHFGMHLAYTAVPSGTGPEFHAEPGEDRAGVCAVDWSGSKRADVVEEACRVAGLPFTRFTDTPHDEMPAEYRKFKVFATATRSDRMSLGVGEALCSGCRVISSTANRGNEWYPGIVAVNPEMSAEGWANHISAGHNAPEWDWIPNRVARTLTWEGQAAGYLAAYWRVLGRS